VGESSILATAYGQLVRQTCMQINLDSQPLRLFFKIRLHESVRLHPNPADAGLHEIAEICACARLDLQHHAGKIGEQVFFVFARELLVSLVETSECPSEDPLSYRFRSENVRSPLTPIALL